MGMRVEIASLMEELILSHQECRSLVGDAMTLLLDFEQQDERAVSLNDRMAAAVKVDPHDEAMGLLVKLLDQALPEDGE